MEWSESVWHSRPATAEHMAIIMLISEATARGPCENTEGTSKPAAILCESNTVAVASCQASTAMVWRNRLRGFLDPRKWRGFLRKAEKKTTASKRCSRRPESPAGAVVTDSFVYLFTVKFRKQGWPQRNSPAKNAIQAVCTHTWWPWTKHLTSQLINSTEQSPSWGST